MATLPSASVLDSENVLILIGSEFAGAAAAAAAVASPVEVPVNWRVSEDTRLVAAAGEESSLCAAGAEVVEDEPETSL